MEVITSYCTLLQKFHTTKDELVKADKALRTIAGSYDKAKDTDWYKRDSGTIARKSVPKNTNKMKCKIKDFPQCESSSDESTDDSAGDSNLSVKRSIQSIVSKVGSNSTKKEVISKQNINPKVESRNRRILGVLQGTLLKFRDEAEKRKSQDLKRKKVEEKVEAAAKDEVERVKKQKLDLMLEKNEKELQLKGLEEMLDIAKYHEIWERSQKHLVNFIVTQSKPQIYFLPATHTEKSKKCLEKSKMEILGKVEKRKSQVKKKMAEIQKSYHLESLQSKVFDSIDSEIKTVEKSKNTHTMLNTRVPANSHNEEDEECSVISLNLKLDDVDDLFI